MLLACLSRQKKSFEKNQKFNKIIRLIAVVIIVLGFLSLTQNSWARSNHFITLQGEGNATGADWANAWSYVNLNTASNWTSDKTANPNKIGPGDTIYLSGGNSGVTYTGDLVAAKSGISGSPITIRCGQDAGHTGKVSIVGGINLGINKYLVVNGELNGTRNIEIYNAATNCINGQNSSGIGCKVLYTELNNCGQGSTYGHGVKFYGSASLLNDVEVAYNLIVNPKSDGVNLETGNSLVGTYGQIKVHHNTIIGPDDDGVQLPTGTDLYDNVIEDVFVHSSADGIQLFYGEYMRIFNNTFKNIQNWAIGLSSGGVEGGSGGHWRIYNNFFYKTSACPGCYNQIGLQNVCAGASNGHGTFTMEDIMVANNTFISGYLTAFSINNRAGFCDKTYTKNVIIANNIFKDTYTATPAGAGFRVDVTDGSGVIVKNNIICGDYHKIFYMGTTYTAAELMDVAEDTLNNTSVCASLDANYFPVALDATALDKGIDLSAYFAADKLGVARPQGAAWDIGAYEYVFGADTLAPAAPVGLRVN